MECPGCLKQISDDAAECPHCGCDIKKEFEARIVVVAKDDDDIISDSRIIRETHTACMGHDSLASGKARATPSRLPTVPDATGLNPSPNPVANSTATFCKNPFM